MHLTRVAMRGFKSFADRTSLDFDRGLVAIVGPNGAGKSNLIDALMWGLGTLSPKTLRADRMEDVIFVGTPTRSVLGMANVTLSFDNTSSTFPINVAEVAIGRTLYRDGASEYTINGAACRLLDVQELMAEAGVGRELHAVVAQGQVDEIVNASGEALRLAIEEAAGITKHRRRAEKAMRKIVGVETDLQRVGDITAEQRKRLRPLKAHAEAAERHSHVASELNEVTIALASAEFVTLRRDREIAHREQEELTQATDELRTELNVSREARAEIESNLSTARAKGGNLRRGLDHIRTAQASALRAVLLQREGSGIAQETVSEKLEALRSTDSQTREELASIEIKLVGLEEADAERRRVALSAAARADAAQASARAAAEKHAQVQAEIRSLTGFAQRAQEEATQSESRKQRAHESAQQSKTQAAEISDQIDRLDAELGTASMHFDRVKDERRGIETEIDVADQQQRAAENSNALLSGRLESLVTTRNLVESRRVAAKELTSQKGVRGLLADHVKPRHGYDKAVNAVFEQISDALVVASGHLKEVLEYAEHTNSDVAFLATTQPSSHQSPPPGAVKMSSLIDVPDWLRPTIEALLAQTWFVENDDEAIDLAASEPHIAIVCKSGRIIRARGISRPAVMRREPVVGLDPAIKEVEAELKVTAEKIKSASQLRDQLGRKISAISSEIDQAASQVAELEGRIAAAADRLRELNATIGAFELEGELAQQDLEAKLSSHASAINSADTLRNDLLSLETARDETDAQAQTAAADVSPHSLDTSSELEHLRLQRALLQERLTNLSQRLSEAAETLEKADNFNPKDLATSELILRSVELFADEINEQVRSDVDATQQLEGELSAVAQQITRTELELTAIEPRVRHLAETIVRCDTLSEQTGNKLAELGIRPADVTEVATDVEALTQRRDKLQAELKRIGPVSTYADTEIAELEERLAFTESQMEDLRSSKRDLVRLVKATEAQMTDMLEVAANDANLKFQEVMEVLFPEGGGRLSIHPDETGSFLNGQIQIEVKLGRKGHRRLAFLSGGERALVGLAFLFALHLARPTPFLVLDEVDAPLDDANLGRFLRFIDSLKASTQVIVVTHQKRTMSHADRLVGVVLNPDGTSSVVSQSLHEFARG